jgi:hypothetical protein
MALEKHFTRRVISGKSIYIVDDHNKALAAWVLERRRLGVAPSLLTIDHHTDVIEAFHGHACVEEYENRDVDGLALEAALLAELNFSDDASVSRAIELLRHDEHIHAATMSGILGSAFCIQLSDHDGSPSLEEIAYSELRKANFQVGLPIGSPPSRPMTYTATPDKIYVISHDCAIGCVKKPYDDDCLIHNANEIIESPYLQDQLNRVSEITTSLGLSPLETVPYILDIDLDVFHTKKAIEPTDPTTFYRLVRTAVAITIATEAECVEEEWLDEDHPTTADELLARMLQHIEAALQ